MVMLNTEGFSVKERPFLSESIKMEAAGARATEGAGRPCARARVRAVRPTSRDAAPTPRERVLYPRSDFPLVASAVLPHRGRAP